MYDGTNIFHSVTDRIRCKLHLGTSKFLDDPKITITGYDAIAANTDVRILFSELEALKDGANTAAGITGRIKIGVNLKFLDLNVEAYIYEPTGIITTPLVSSGASSIGHIVPAVLTPAVPTFILENSITSPTKGEEVFMTSSYSF
jgi:hypothetical protein